MKFELLLLYIFLEGCLALQVREIHRSLYTTARKAEGNDVRNFNLEKRDDLFETNKDLVGFIHGDVMPTEKSRNTVQDPRLLWQGTIPYVIANDENLGVDLEGVAAINDALQEYKFRTCLNFTAREMEQDYIVFEKRTGCFSYVGRIGGKQTISIGSGCQHASVVIHEIMHALGIWHEQSRIDRDDYVTIIWDAIESGKENNFEIAHNSDHLGFSYDHSSVMHYHDTAFSVDGTRTIVTKNPVFQDVIGQRSTFSVGDSAKINKMYDCGEPLLNSYNCNFNDGEVCGYSQDLLRGNVDWLRYNSSNNSLPVSTNAPNTDATFGVLGKGAYLLLDTSQEQSGQLAFMQSTTFITKSRVQCLQFSFYLRKNSSSSAAISIYISSENESSDPIRYGELITTIDANFGNSWILERIAINAPPEYRITFVGMTDNDRNDVVAIDDVSVQDKNCAGNYVIFENYSSVLATYSTDEFTFSPVLTSSEGYNFQLQLYPRGDDLATAGYMSMYFRVVTGPRDDNLTWPFCNKRITMMILDQIDNPLLAMNVYRSFVTCYSGGTERDWEEPDSSQTSYFFGYSNFMELRDLTMINNYLKHDSLMISVIVEDVVENVENNGDVRSVRLSTKVLFSSLLLLWMIKKQNV